MFFKKKKKQVTPKELVMPLKTPEELKDMIKEAESTLLNEGDHAEAYASLAQCYQALGEVDKAIEHYEACLETNKSLGSNYNELLKLYNIKRRHAAEAKDQEAIQLYLNKMDALMQLSKDVIRGKI